MQLNREGTKTSSSDVCAPNLSGDSITDEDLIRAFILALAAGGRKPKTLTVYQESVRSLSAFARDLGLPRSLRTKKRVVETHA